MKPRNQSVVQAAVVALLLLHGATAAVRAANVPPTASIPASAGTIMDNQMATPFSAIVIGDPDADAVSVTFTLPAGRGSFVESPPDFTLSGTTYTLTKRSPAAAQTFIRSLDYTPVQNRIFVNSPAEGTAFSISISDTNGASTNISTTLNVTAHNDAPTISGTAATAEITDKNTNSPFTSVVIADVDNLGAQPVTLTVTNQDMLKGAFVSGTNIFSIPVSNVFTFTGTPAAAQAAIRDLRYKPVENRIPVNQRETNRFTIGVADDGVPALNDTDTATRVPVISTNDAPSIAGVLAGPQPVRTGRNISPFAPTIVTDPDVNDTPGRIGQSLTLRVLLSGVIGDGALQNSAGFSGSDFHLTDLTPGEASQALQGLQYRAQTAALPPGTTNTITASVTVTDVIGAITNRAATFAVYSLFVPPGLGGTVADQRVNDPDTIAPFATVSVQSFNAGTFAVKVELDNVKGEMINLAGFVKTVAAGRATYRFDGTSENATLAIRQLLFRPTANRLDGDETETVVFDITLLDGGISVGPDSSTTVIVSPVNDRPTIGGISPLIRINDNQTTLPFSGVAIADADELAAQLVRVTVTPDDTGKGLFTTNSLALSGFVSNSGAYRFTNTPVAVSIALRQLAFNPTDNLVPLGLATNTVFSITADDGHGGITVNSDTIVRVASAAGVPTISVPAQQPISRPITPPILPFDAVTISDSDALTVTVTLANPLQGFFTTNSLALSGFTSNGGGRYVFQGLAAAANAAIIQLDFAPNTNVPPGLVSFTISALDSTSNLVSDTLNMQLRLVQRSLIVTRTDDYASGQTPIPGTLRKAVDDAGSDDHITFDIRPVTNGVPAYPAVIRLRRSITLLKSVVIDGPGAGQLTISGDTDGNGSADVPLLEIYADATLHRLTLTKGKGGAAGGAAAVKLGGSLRLSYCAVTDSTADQWGGGIDVEGGSLFADHCLFHNNATSAALGQGGGGVSIFTDLNCAIENSTFSANKQQAPGGLGGGALYVENMDLGSALTVNLSSCTFKDNTDAANGGTAIRPNVFGSLVRLRNTLLGDGQGNNLETDQSGLILFDGGNISDDSTRTEFSSGGAPYAVTNLNHPTDLISTDPDLVALAANNGPTRTHAFTASSPAFANAVMGAPGTDQRGFWRDAQPDIGAFESNTFRQIIINEIQFAPTGNTDDEFIEFYMPRYAEAVDVAGFTVCVGGVVRHIFGSRALLPGQALVLLGTNATSTVPVTATGPFLQRSSQNLRIADTGDTITIKNAAGLVVYEASFVASYTSSDPMGGAGLEPGQSVTLYPEFTGVFLPHRRAETNVAGVATAATSSPGRDVIGTPIGAGNAPPIAIDDFSQTDENTALTILVLANDLEFDRLDVIRVTNAMSPSTRGGAVTINNSPRTGASVTYDPTGSTYLRSLPAGSNVVDTFSYSILDCCNPVGGLDWPATGTKYTATNYVTVLGVNDAPEPVADSGSTNLALRTTEDAGIIIMVQADLLSNDDDPDTDDDANSLLIAAVHGGSMFENTLTAVSAFGAQVTLDIRFNRNETRILYDPSGSVILNSLAAGQITNDTFYYSVVDRHGAIGTAAVLVRVTGVNDQPGAGDDLAATDEDTTITLGQSFLLGNDADPDTLDVLRITGLNGVSLVSTSAFGAALTNTGTGIIYDPSVPAALNALARKEVVVDSFSYTAIDDQGGTTTATVSIRVTGVNDRPRPVLDTRATSEDALLSEAAPGVLANDLDPDVNGSAPDDVLRAIPASGVTIRGASYAVGANGGFSFDPRGVFDYLGNGQTTNDSFRYVVVDDSYTVANDDLFSVAADSAGIPLAVLANDVTLTGTGGSLRITTVGTPDSGGTVARNVSNTALVYTPQINFVGVETFQYAMEDGQGGRDTATVRVTVTVPQLNGNLVVNPDSFTVARGTTVTLDALANDNILPAGGGTLTLLSAGPTDRGGVATVSGTGPNNVITYAPDAATVLAFPYGETFAYTVSGGGNVTATGVVTITVVDRRGVLPANDDVFTVIAGGSNNSLDVLANDRVVPGTVTNLTITGLRTNGVSGRVAINAAGNRLLYTPPTGALSHVEPVFSYFISDGSGGSGTGQVMVTTMQMGLNANADFCTVATHSTNGFFVLNNDNALPNVGQNLLITSIGLGSNAPNRGGRVTISANSKSLVYSPSPTNMTGEETFTYEIADGSIVRAQGRVKLSIVDRTGRVNVNADSFSVARDTADNVLSVLRNDNVRPDTRERLTLTAAGTPDRGGTVRIAGTAPNQVLLYTAPPGFVGDEQFTYAVADNRGGTGSTTVRVRVGYLAARDDLFTVLSDSLSNALPVLTNDLLLPNVTPGRLLRSAGATDRGGVVQLNAGSNAVLYTPAAGWVGTETFTYQVADDSGGLITGRATVAVLLAGADRATQTVVITILGTNDTPTIVGAVAGQTMTDKETRLPFTGVTIGELDAYGLQPLTVTVALDDAAKGVLLNLGPFVDAGGGRYAFTGIAAAATAAIHNLLFDPTENRITVPTTEATRFTILANDSFVTTTNDTTTVLVTAVNDPPTIAGTVAGQTVYHRLTIRPFASVTITEVDDLTLQPLRVTVTLDRATNGYLASLGGFVEAGAGVYRLTNATAAVATVALRAMIFVPTTSNRLVAGTSETTRFTLTVDDEFPGGAVSDNTTTVIARHAFTKKLLASDGSDEDEFGYSVATTRDVMAVGVPFDDPNGSKSGAVYLFARNAGGPEQWGEIKKLVAFDAASGDRFGYRVAMSGDTLVVGAPEDTHSGVDSGSAYVFERNQGGPGQWGFVKKLLSSDRASDDDFGQAVSISGNTIVIGAPDDTHNSKDSGSAYVFQRDLGGPANWGQAKKLLPPDGSDDDEFGFAASVNGDTIVVGSRLDDDRGGNSGSAYVFDRNQGGSGEWGQIRKLLAADGDSDDEFGHSVAISGDLILIGAPSDSDDDDDCGAAYVFARHQGGTNQWGQARKLLPFDGDDDDEFGFAVAIDRELMVVGSRMDDHGGTESGSAYVFVRNHPSLPQWSLVEKLVPHDPHECAEFGYAVALSQGTVAIGARKDDGSGDRFGSTYVYRLHFNNAPFVANPIPDQTAPTNLLFTFALDSFGDRDGGDTLLLSAALAGPTPLPGWLSFDPVTRTFLGMPTTVQIFTIVVTATDDGGETASDEFTLTITPGAGPALVPLHLWRLREFLTVALDPGQEASTWGDAADPDLDGRSNLAEYLFGTNPLIPDPGAATIAIAKDPSAPGDVLITFKRRTNDPRCTYEVQGTGDFVTWSPVVPLQTDSSQPETGEIERVTLRVNIPSSLLSYRFFRVQANY